MWKLREKLPKKEQIKAQKCKPVGGELVELRVHSGPGYRVYCWKDGLTVVVALGGGDKSSQERDIAKAQHMVTVLKE